MIDNMDFDNIDEYGFAIYPIIAAGNPFAGGNSRLARSLRAKAQRRDRYGRFAFMFGSMGFDFFDDKGTVHTALGKFIGPGSKPDTLQVLVENDPILGTGIAEVNSNNASQYIANLSPAQLKKAGIEVGKDADGKVVSARDKKIIPTVAQLNMTDTPNGWAKDEDGNFVSADNAYKIIKPSGKSKSWGLSEIDSSGNAKKPSSHATFGEALREVSDRDTRALLTDKEQKKLATLEDDLAAVEDTETDGDEIAEDQKQSEIERLQDEIDDVIKTGDIDESKVSEEVAAEADQQDNAAPQAKKQAAVGVEDTRSSTPANLDLRWNKQLIPAMKRAQGELTRFMQQNQQNKRPATTKETSDFFDAFDNAFLDNGQLLKYDADVDAFQELTKEFFGLDSDIARANAKGDSKLVSDLQGRKKEVGTQLSALQKAISSRAANLEPLADNPTVDVSTNFPETTDFVAPSYKKRAGKGRPKGTGKNQIAAKQAQDAQAPTAPEAEAGKDGGDQEPPTTPAAPVAEEPEGPTPEDRKAEAEAKKAEAEARKAEAEADTAEADAKAAETEEIKSAIKSVFDQYGGDYDKADPAEIDKLVDLYRANRDAKEELEPWTKIGHEDPWIRERHPNGPITKDMRDEYDAAREELRAKQKATQTAKVQAQVALIKSTQTEETATPEAEAPAAPAPAKAAKVKDVLTVPTKKWLTEGAKDGDKAWLAQSGKKPREIVNIDGYWYDSASTDDNPISVASGEELVSAMDAGRLAVYKGELPRKKDNPIAPIDSFQEVVDLRREQNNINADKKADRDAAKQAQEAAKPAVTPEPVAELPAEAEEPAGEGTRRTSIDGWSGEENLANWQENVKKFKTDSGSLSDQAMATAEMQGMDGAPEALSDDEFDAFDGEPLFRGFSSADHKEKFYEDENWVGTGGNGTGIYTSTSQSHAARYGNFEESRIVDLKLRPDAVIMDVADLEARRQADFEKAMSEGNLLGAQLASGDLGLYATAIGVDGYRADLEGFPSVVLTNREAVVARKSDATAEVEAPAPATEAPATPEPVAPAQPKGMTPLEYNQLLENLFAENEQRAAAVVDKYDNEAGDFRALFDSGADGAALLTWLVNNSDAYNAEKIYLDGVDNRMKAGVRPTSADRNRQSLFNWETGAIQNLPTDTPENRAALAEAPSTEKDAYGKVIGEKTYGMELDALPTGARLKSIPHKSADNLLRSGNLTKQADGTWTYDEDGTVAPDIKQIADNNKIAYLGSPELEAAAPEEVAPEAEAAPATKKKMPVVTKNDDGSVTIAPVRGEPFTVAKADISPSGLLGIARSADNKGYVIWHLPTGYSVPKGKTFPSPAKDSNSLITYAKKADAKAVMNGLDASGIDVAGIKLNDTQTDKDKAIINEIRDWMNAGDVSAKKATPEPEATPTEPVEAPATREAVELNVNGDLKAQIEQAIADGNDLTFYYQGSSPAPIKRTVTPDSIWTNPKTGEDNLYAFPEGEDKKKNFTLSKMSNAPEAETPAAPETAPQDTTPISDVVAEPAVDLSPETREARKKALKEQLDADAQEQRQTIVEETGFEPLPQFREDSTTGTPELEADIETAPTTEAEVAEADAIEPTADETAAEADADLSIITTRTTDEDYADEAYLPTEEQRNVIDATVSELDVSVQALAGSGKTSTLVLAAKQLLKYHPDKKILYIAFNKTVQLEAEGRMPSENTEARTGDSLGWWGVDSSIRGKMGKGDALPKKIADHLKIPTTTKNREDIAQELTKVIESFSISDSDTIGKEHFDAAEVEFSDMKLAYAQMYWADLNDANGQIRVTNSHLTKMWALTNPDLGQAYGGGKNSFGKADVIFFDEAQDINPVMAKVIRDQNIQKIYVGDSNQAIYGFRGADDELDKVDTDITLPMTRTFRFGQTLAGPGNRMLSLLKSKYKIIGAGKTDGTVIPAGTMNDADAVLTRTNGGRFTEIISELGKGRIVGLSREDKADAERMLATVRWLKFGGKKPYPAHEDFDGYTSWSQVSFDVTNKKASGKVTTIANIFDNPQNNLDIKSIATALAEVKVIDNDVNVIDYSAGSTGTVIPKVTYSVADAGNGEVTVTIAGGFRDMQKLVPLLRPSAFLYDGTSKTYSMTGTPADIQKTLDGITGVPSANVDVVVSTAHKAKGLEWGRVRIGDDFRGPEPDAEGNLVFPEKQELNLAYVALTRAEDAIDAGSLSWVYDYTSDDDEDPAKPSRGLPDGVIQEGTVAPTEPETAEETPATEEVTQDIIEQQEEPVGTEDNPVTPSAVAGQPEPAAEPETDVTTPEAPAAPASEAPSAPEAPSVEEPAGETEVVVEEQEQEAAPASPPTPPIDDDADVQGPKPPKKPDAPLIPNDDKSNLDPAPAETTDTGVEGVSNDPQDIAETYDNKDLKEALVTAVENDEPGINIEGENGNNAIVPVENVRDALQKQGTNTNDVIDEALGDPEVQGVPAEILSTEDSKASQSTEKRFELNNFLATREVPKEFKDAIDLIATDPSATDEQIDWAISVLRDQPDLLKEKKAKMPKLPEDIVQADIVDPGKIMSLIERIYPNAKKLSATGDLIVHEDAYYDKKTKTNFVHQLGVVRTSNELFYVYAREINLTTGETTSRRVSPFTHSAIALNNDIIDAVVEKRDRLNKTLWFNKANKRSHSYFIQDESQVVLEDGSTEPLHRREEPIHRDLVEAIKGALSREDLSTQVIQAIYQDIARYGVGDRALRKIQTEYDLDEASFNTIIDTLNAHYSTQYKVRTYGVYVSADFEIPVEAGDIGWHRNEFTGEIRYGLVSRRQGSHLSKGYGYTDYLTFYPIVGSDANGKPIYGGKSSITSKNFTIDKTAQGTDGSERIAGARDLINIPVSKPAVDTPKPVPPMEPAKPKVKVEIDRSEPAKPKVTVDGKAKPASANRSTSVANFVPEDVDASQLQAGDFFMTMDPDLGIPRLAEVVSVEMDAEAGKVKVTAIIPDSNTTATAFEQEWDVDTTNGLSGQRMIAYRRPAPAAPATASDESVQELLRAMRAHDVSFLSAEDAQEISDFTGRYIGGEELTQDEVDALLGKLAETPLRNAAPTPSATAIKVAQDIVDADADSGDRQDLQEVVDEAKIKESELPEESDEPNILTGFNIKQNANGVYYPEGGIKKGSKLYKAIRRGQVIPPNFPFITSDTDWGGVMYFDSNGDRHWGQFGAAGAVLRVKDANGDYKYLLARRASGMSTGGGKWSVPGGAHDTKDDASTPSITAARELYEELGINSNGSKLAGEAKKQVAPDWAYDYSVIETDDESVIDGIDLKKNPEISELGWFTADEIRALQANDEMHGDVDSAILDDIFNIGDVADDAEVIDSVVEIEPDGFVDLTGFTNTAGQGGSNPGGVYQGPDGKKYYAKFQRSDMHAANEVAAAKLYNATGVTAVDVNHGALEGKDNVTQSPIIYIDPNKGPLTDPALRKLTQEGFAIDAWLANWDGVLNDNTGADGLGKPVRMDVGGSLLFRARGGAKGAQFGDTVNEIDSLRDPSVNSTSAAIYGSMTDAEIKDSAKKLLNISEDDIDRIIDDSFALVDNANQSDVDSLKATLKARRKDILDRFGLTEGETPEPTAPTADEVTPESTPEVAPETPAAPEPAETLPADGVNAPEASYNPNEAAVMDRNFNAIMTNFNVIKDSQDGDNIRVEYGYVDESGFRQMRIIGVRKTGGVWKASKDSDSKEVIFDTDNGVYTLTDDELIAKLDALGSDKSESSKVLRFGSRANNDGTEITAQMLKYGYGPLGQMTSPNVPTKMFSPDEDIQLNLSTSGMLSGFFVGYTSNGDSVEYAPSQLYSRALAGEKFEIGTPRTAVPLGSRVTPDWVNSPKAGDEMHLYSDLLGESFVANDQGEWISSITGLPANKIALAQRGALRVGNARKAFAASQGTTEDLLFGFQRNTRGGVSKASDASKFVVDKLRPGSFITDGTDTYRVERTPRSTQFVNVATQAVLTKTDMRKVWDLNQDKFKYVTGIENLSVGDTISDIAVVQNSPVGTVLKRTYAFSAPNFKVAGKEITNYYTYNGSNWRDNNGDYISDSGMIARIRSNEIMLSSTDDMSTPTVSTNADAPEAEVVDTTPVSSVEAAKLFAKVQALPTQLPQNPTEDAIKRATIASAFVALFPRSNIDLMNKTQAAEFSKFLDDLDTENMTQLQLGEAQLRFSPSLDSALSSNNISKKEMLDALSMLDNPDYITREGKTIFEGLAAIPEAIRKTDHRLQNLEFHPRGELGYGSNRFMEIVNTIFPSLSDKPTVLKTKQELLDYQGKSPIIYRSVRTVNAGGKRVPPRELHRQLREDDGVWHGSGVYGQGHYFAEDISVPLNSSSYNDGPGDRSGLAVAKISADANVFATDDPSDDNYVSLVEFKNKVIYAYLISLGYVPGTTAWNDMLNQIDRQFLADAGARAAFFGYDTLNLTNNNYHVILNRAVGVYYDGILTDWDLE